MQMQVLAAAVVLAVTLAGCGGGEPSPAPAEDGQALRGAIEGVIASVRGASGLRDRPTAMLGVLSSAFVAQGMFLPTQSALEGIDAQASVIRGQQVPTASETFALLQQLGTVLQVDVIDTLNRASDRRALLDEYVESLRGVATIALRREDELSLQVDEFKSQLRERKSAANDIDRKLREVLRDDDYAQAAVLQEQLIAAESAVTEVEVKLEQAEDLQDRYESVLAIARERLTAIEVNRAILIAGLRVVNVPGIEDFAILDEPSGRRQREQQEDILGTEFIRE